MKLERSVISADDNFHREMTIFYGSIEGDLFKGTEASSLAIDMARTDMGFKNFTGYQDFESLKSFEFSTYFSKSNIVLYVFVHRFHKQSCTLCFYLVFAQKSRVTSFANWAVLRFWNVS